jgi:hypothetical protein
MAIARNSLLKQDAASSAQTKLGYPMTPYTPTSPSRRVLIIDDLGMRKLAHTAAEDLLELIMRR